MEGTSFEMLYLSLDWLQEHAKCGARTSDLEKALQLVKDVFISAAERDVYTGDALKICVVTKDGIKEETIQLRKD